MFGPVLGKGAKRILRIWEVAVQAKGGRCPPLTFCFDVCAYQNVTHIIVANDETLLFLH